MDFIQKLRTSSKKNKPQANPTIEDGASPPLFSDENYNESSLSSRRRPSGWTIENATSAIKVNKKEKHKSPERRESIPELDDDSTITASKIQTFTGRGQDLPTLEELTSQLNAVNRDKSQYIVYNDSKIQEGIDLSILSKHVLDVSDDENEVWTFDSLWARVKSDINAHLVKEKVECERLNLILPK